MTATPTSAPLSSASAEVRGGAAAPGSLRLALRMTARDWRAGELRLLLVSLAVAVAAIACVGFFADRMRGALSGEARQLIGADWVLAADRPIGEALADRARAAGLAVASTATFPSMVVAADGAPQLASVKAVSEGYPLRGRLRVASAPGAPDEPADAIPARGTAWVDAQLLGALGARLGDTVRLGEAPLRLARIITLEPDRGASFVNFAPRILVGMNDLAASGLVQPASRVGWRLMVAGDAPALARFAAQVKPAQGQQIESLESGRPELRVTLDRAERFLSLVALLSALIAAVAIALAARRFALRHLDACAVLRALGATQARITALLAWEMLAVALAGSLIGVAVGLAAHFGLVALAAPLIDLPLPAPGVRPALQALAAGLLLVTGFAIVPVARLAGVPALRVMRRDLGAPPVSAWLAALAALAAFAALLRWFAGDGRLAGIALGGFAVGAVVFAGAAWLLVRLVGPMRRLLTAGPLARLPGAALVRLALAGWSRRQGASVAQTAALAVALMALILLAVVRGDLLDGWRRAAPVDAPNRFLINVQPDQREAVQAALTARGLTRFTLYPMVRGRLVAVNGELVSPDSASAPRAARLLDREFNLSYMAEQPSHNQTVQGRWLDPAAPEVSVEQGIMVTLGLAVGDLLRFDVAGQPVEARVVGARKLAWDSMQVNFFMILSPAALADAPQTLITSFHADAAHAGTGAELVREFPNLTVFDTGNIVRQVQTMLSQVSRAVEFLFLFTLAAGIVVLYAALVGSRDERLREAALLRALGASRAQLARMQQLELTLAGALAGALAAAGAIAVGAVLAEQVFRFEYVPRWSTLPLGLVAGAACALAGGWLGLRGVLREAPLTSLRDG